MKSFNLSMVEPIEPKGQVKASKDYPTKTDPDTGATEKVLVTDGGIDINKKAAPILKLDGPMGHYYTELLQKELSLESMGAIAAATARPELEPGTVPVTSGKIAIDDQGVHSADESSDGYIFVVEGDSLKAGDLGSISKNFLEKRAQFPERPLGIAMITDGSPSATMESLTRCLQAADVHVTYSRRGVTRMAVDMLMKGQ